MKSQGYSLVEIMVVVAIIGIIAAVAYPSYQGYMRDTYDGQAVADLKTCALALDRYYSNGFTYLGATVGTGNDDTCYQYSPTDTGASDARYEISFETLTRNAYTIRATPTGQGSCIEITQDGSQTLC